MVIGMRSLRKLVCDNPTARDALDKVTQGKQGARTDLVDNVHKVDRPFLVPAKSPGIKLDNVQLDQAPTGNSESLGISQPTVSEWLTDIEKRKSADFDTAPESRQHFDVWQFATADKDSGSQSYFGAVPRYRPKRTSVGGRWKRDTIKQDFALPDNDANAWRVAMGKAGLVLDVAGRAAALGLSDPRRTVQDGARRANRRPEQRLAAGAARPPHV